MPTPRVDLLSLGDELLLGIRANAHLVYLGALLSRYGLPVTRNVVLRDRPDEIRREFSQSWAEADIVITTGGLGPTTDDLTRETVAEVLGRPLRRDATVEADIRARFERMGRILTDNNLAQANIVEGADTIPNRFGTAPGQWYEADGKLLLMLPGPGSELRPMVEDQVLPRLQERGWAQPGEVFLQLRTCGIGESQLDARLRPVFAPFGDALQVAYCAHVGMVDVRLAPGPGQLSWEEITALGESCREILGVDFVGFGDGDLAALVINQVRQLNRTLAVAESCTGGLLASALTDVPGASKAFVGGLVCYTNEAKMALLEVPDCILQQHGAVSPECAAAMAAGVAERFDTDYALAITGFAGPGGGTRDNPVGTVHFGFVSPCGVWSHKAVHPGNRLQVKERAVNLALDWMRRKLLKYDFKVASRAGAAGDRQ